MKMMTALALVLASAPAAYAAGMHENESFIQQVGSTNHANVSQTKGNNNQATAQTGQANSVQSTQASGSRFTDNSANVQVGNVNTAQITQNKGNNNQSTFQVGRANGVTTTQTGKLVNGENNSGNIQVGEFNSANTTQKNSAPNSQATGVDYSNNSFSAQFGSSMTTVKQTGGQNNQGTYQVGTGNLAFTTQSDKAITDAKHSPVGGANTSFTGQFGDSNQVNATQTTADASAHEGGGFANGYGNTSAAFQYGTGNKAVIDQKASAKGTEFSANPGTFNASGTMQAGYENTLSVTQGGNTAGNFGATPADQAANDTNASYVGQVGAKNDAVVNQTNGANTQATFQNGYDNTATIGQKTKALGTGDGANNAMTAQFGVKNVATVTQSMAVPLALGENNSFVTQIGGSNVVNATQTTGQQAMAGNNNQYAMQVGYANSAKVTQSTGSNVTNTSFTAQFGAHNQATVVQK